MANKKSYDKNLFDSFFSGLLSVFGGGGNQKADIVSPIPEPTKAVKADQTTSKKNTDQGIINYFKDQLGSQNPARNDPKSYFPILNDLGYMSQKEDQYKRPGLKTLLALQSLFESTGGRSGNNAFGVKPTDNRKFSDLKDAIDYQTGSRVLGGGAGNKLNLLTGKTGQITPDEIKNVYSSYNPNSSYLDKLLTAYKKIEGM